MEEIEHSIDGLRLYSTMGEPIQDVIDALKGLQRAAHREKLKNLRVRIAQRTNMATIDPAVPNNPKLRLFVVGDK